MQQVAWTEQVRGKPRAARQCGAAQAGAGCQAGLEPAGEAGLGSLGAQEAPGRLPAGPRGQRLSLKEGSWQGVGRGCCCLPLSGPPAVLSAGWAFAQAA